MDKPRKYPEYDRTKDGNHFDWILEQTKLIRAQAEADRIVRHAIKAAKLHNESKDK